MAPATTVTLNESQLAPGGNQVRIVKIGDGRLYWSTRGDYYSNAAEGGEHRQLQAEHGAPVLQAHVACRRTAASSITSTRSTGPVQVGDTLAVRITVGGNDWKYLMIEDPIPSGTESIARDDLYELDEKPNVVGALVQRSRAARRSHYVLQHVLPARAA